VAAESPQALTGMLERNSANYAPLTPVAFLRRGAEVYPTKTAVIHGDRTFTYREFEERCRRLASALRAFRPDVVQGWLYHANIAATLATFLVRRNTPVMWSIRGAPDWSRCR